MYPKEEGDTGIPWDTMGYHIHLWKSHHLQLSVLQLWMSYGGNYDMLWQCVHTGGNWRCWKFSLVRLQSWSVASLVASVTGDLRSFPIPVTKVLRPIHWADQRHSKLPGGNPGLTGPGWEGCWIDTGKWCFPILLIFGKMNPFLDSYFFRWGSTTNQDIFFKGIHFGTLAFLFFQRGPGPHGKHGPWLSSLHFFWD